MGEGSGRKSSAAMVWPEMPGATSHFVQHFVRRFNAGQHGLLLVENPVLGDGQRSPHLVARREFPETVNANAPDDGEATWQRPR